MGPSDERRAAGRRTTAADGTRAVGRSVRRVAAGTAPVTIRTGRSAAGRAGAYTSRLGFDALVQREVPENVRTCVSTWCETRLQVVWVVGGVLGIVLSLEPHVGFPVCAVAMVATVAMAVPQRRRARRTATPRARPA